MVKYIQDYIKRGRIRYYGDWLDYINSKEDKTNG